jgi:hypothetical protein
MTESHRGYHRRVADGLQLHVAAILALEFHDDEIRAAVKGEEIDSPAAPPNLRIPRR